MTDWYAPDPDPTRPEREPRKCRRHVWVAYPLRDGPDQWCSRCSRWRDAPASKRGRNNRKRGNQDELVVARLLGGDKLGPLGLPWDVEVPGYLRLQCKKLDRWPSLAKVIEWLDAIPPQPELRGVTLADAPGGGAKTRRLLIVDLDEFAAWHGRKP